MKKQIILSLIFLIICSSAKVFAQETSDSLATTAESKAEIMKALQKGIVIPLDKNGKSWLKILTFGQFTAKYNGDPGQNATAPASNSTSILSLDRTEKKTQLAVERARFIAAANFFDKVFLFSQFGTTGLGGLNNDNINTLGQEPESQLGLITMYGELNFKKEFGLGIGLHNYRGVSRYNNAGLVDLITQDLDTSLIPSFGQADQLSYPLGVFVKGTVGKVRYQFAIDDVSRNNLSRELYNQIDANLVAGGAPLNPEQRDAANPLAPNQISAVYRGAELLGGAKAGTSYSGYVTYHLLDEESDRISFRTGSYFGTKKVFNIGGGFFFHPNGSVRVDGSGDLKGENVNVLGVDVYYDAPINSKKDAITFYGLYQNMNYGKNFNLSQYDNAIYPITAPGLNQSASLPFATGNMQYSQLAYFNRKLKVQPYGFYQNRNIDATGDHERIFGFGANYLLVGPNVRLSGEYRNRKLADNDSDQQVVLQMMFFM